MKIQVLLCMYQGIVDTIYLFKTEQEAFDQFKWYTDVSWKDACKLQEETGYMFKDSNFEGTNIYECELNDSVKDVENDYIKYLKDNSDVKRKY